MVCHSETGFVWNVIPLDFPLSSRPLVSLGVSHRHEILYNLGIQLLFSGRPVVAFDCLVEAVQIYHTNPRLWLRLAECCIVAFQLVSTLHHCCTVLTLSWLLVH